MGACGNSLKLLLQHINRKDRNLGPLTKIDCLNLAETVLASKRQPLWATKSAFVELSLAVVVSQLSVWWAMILFHRGALLQPLVLHSHKQWAEHDCQHDAFILAFFQEIGSALILVVVAIIHYYSFIYNENSTPVKLGMVFLACILPQERSGCDAETMRVCVLEEWASGCLYEGRVPTPQLQQLFIGSIFWCKTESLPQGACPTF